MRTRRAQTAGLLVGAVAKLLNSRKDLRADRGRTPGWSLMTRDTALLETPACAATSLIVGTGTSAAAAGL